MATRIICDACDQPIITIGSTNALTLPQHQGATLALHDGMNPDKVTYSVTLHQDCAHRILQAIGRERQAIKDERDN